MTPEVLLFVIASKLIDFIIQDKTEIDLDYLDKLEIRKIISCRKFKLKKFRSHLDYSSIQKFRSHLVNSSIKKFRYLT